MPEAFAKSLGSVFEPEVVDTLTDAFRKAWEQYQAQNGHDGKQLVGVREVLVRRIVEMATDGERDVAKLRDGALADLAANLDQTTE